jgi:flagellar biosynthesis GTPase FlhF
MLAQFLPQVGAKSVTINKDMRDAIFKKSAKSAQFIFIFMVGGGLPGGAMYKGRGIVQKNVTNATLRLPRSELEWFSSNTLKIDRNLWDVTDFEAEDGPMVGLVMKIYDRGSPPTTGRKPKAGTASTSAAAAAAPMSQSSDNTEDSDSEEDDTEEDDTEEDDTEEEQEDEEEEEQEEQKEDKKKKQTQDTPSQSQPGQASSKRPIPSSLQQEAAAPAAKKQKEATSDDAHDLHHALLQIVKTMASEGMCVLVERLTTGISFVVQRVDDGPKFTVNGKIVDSMDAVMTQLQQGDGLIDRVGAVEGG